MHTRRALGIVAVLSLVLVTPALAQTPPQLTNEDLLKLIGMKEIQALQCGKALEAAQQQLQALQQKAGPSKNAESPSPAGEKER